MTRDEVKVLLAIIYETYPNFKPHNKLHTLEVWEEILAMDDLEDVKGGLLTYIRNDTSGFAPTIGQILESRQRLETEDDTEKAVANIRRAVANGYYGFAEEFEKLSKIEQKAVGDPKNLRMWAQLETKAFESVMTSHIRKAYRNAKEDAKIQDRMKAFTGGDYGRISKSEIQGLLQSAD